jgi:2-polyprenyl-3-methyl-5-hydroxy-6-metoxy-1,4-benzoquinol methylase
MSSGNWPPHQGSYIYHDVPRAEMIDFVPEGTRRLLDVGCGRGGFGEALKQRKPMEVHGVEVDPTAATTAAQRYDSVIVGSFPEDIPSVAAYDCIVFNDILEHMVDPWGALRAARSILTSDGAVVASIPNMRYWPVFWRLVTKGEWSYISDGVLDRTHLRFFTANSINELFADSGFTVRRLTPINLIEFSQVDRPSARVLRTICRFREAFGMELRAQQFAIVASATRTSDNGEPSGVGG